jgi:branched-chain amino acid transport system permease protein
VNLIARVRARSPYPQIVAVTIVALVVPLVLPELTFYMQLLMSAIVVVGLSLFMGYAGQAALGQ